MTYREICLQEAKRAVCQSREREYGSPEDSFQQIRELWEVYLGMPLAPHDVAMMMALLKIARIKTGAFKEDSFVDAAGYIACGYEIVMQCELRRAESGNGGGEQTGDRDKTRAVGEAREETGKRGDSEGREENDTPPDTDTRTDTDP